MTEHTHRLLDAWFTGLNLSDLNRLLNLFSHEPTIRNAANPVLTGPRAAHTLLHDFFSRTAARSFTMIDAAEADGHVFASWTAVLTFRPGVSIGGVTLAEQLTVPLRGIDRFKFDESAHILELDIHHETTSIPAAARAAAASHPEVPHA